MPPSPAVGSTQTVNVTVNVPASAVTGQTTTLSNSAIITALGVALWLSAINVKYRDVNQALPFLTQFWLFATPVAYSFSSLSEKLQILLSTLILHTYFSVPVHALR